MDELKKCSGVLCDKRMPVKLKGKVYRTVVRPAMLYGAETWATTKRQESRIEVNEMRMLRWMCGVTRKDKIRNEHIRGTTIVVQASRKITERRLKWYGHVMRMEEDHVVRRVMTKAIPGKRKRGRPKTRWKDVCKRDMQTGLTGKRRSTTRAATPDDGNSQRKRRRRMGLTLNLCRTLCFLVLQLIIS